jgi:hypothetical protein
MAFTDRFTEVFQQGGSILRSFSFIFGLNLILAGLIILLFPEILVMMIALAFILGGLTFIASGWSRKRVQPVRIKYWD